AEFHWRMGLRHWGAGLRGAVNGISLLFGRADTVHAIEAHERATGSVLHRYEQTLGACSATVGRLGPPPPSLVLARREALHTCKSFESAAELIRVGVKELQNGLGMDVLQQSSDALSDGEDGLRRTLLDLQPSG